MLIVCSEYEVLFADDDDDNGEYEFLVCEFLSYGFEKWTPPTVTSEIRTENTTFYCVYISLWLIVYSPT